jgi:hypothetical protein
MHFDLGVFATAAGPAVAGSLPAAQDLHFQAAVAV